jgi:hypothetical protein
MSDDVMRVHIGKEEWTLVEFVDAFLSYRERAEKAEEAVDHCNREMNNALAQVDRLKASAEKAERYTDDLRTKYGEMLSLRDEWKALAEKAAQDLAVERQVSSQLLKTSDNRGVLLEKAERERDEAKAELSIEAALHHHHHQERDRLMAGACAICATCEGPLTCAKCVPVKPPGIALFDDPNIVRTVLDDLDDHEARLKALESLLLDPSDCKGCRGLCHACDR